MRRVLLALPCLLAACGDPGGDYPALVPVESLLEPDLPPHAAAASPARVTAEVARAGAATQARAAAVAEVGVDPELLARAEALRMRAQALRDAGPGA